MNSFFDKNINHLLDQKGISIEELASDLGISISNSKLYANDILAISQYFAVSVNNLLSKDLSEKKDDNIKLLILDIDGVMTDGGMYYTAAGDEFKKFNTKDGRAIISFIKRGGQVGIISSGFRNEIIISRAKTLGIQNVYVGLESKEIVLQAWLEDLNIPWSEVAYIGDDINDLEVMQKVGLSSCPIDAVDEIKEISDIILSKRGGEGCVREFVAKHIQEVKM